MVDGQRREGVILLGLLLAINHQPSTINLSSLICNLYNVANELLQSPRTEVTGLVPSWRRFFVSAMTCSCRRIWQKVLAMKARRGTVAALDGS